MSGRQLQFLEVAGADGRTQSIAFWRDAGQAGTAPGLIWLCGFKSDMTGGKATAVAEWAKTRGAGCVRFDYSGHGRSSGRFEEGTIGEWLEQASAVFTHLTHGPQILIGSSMGAWIALLLARRWREQGEADSKRLAGLVLIAPAWDMTQLMWDHAPEEARQAITEQGVYLRPSHYGEDPYPITGRLIEEGRSRLLAGAPFDPGCPVRILHGMRDPDVPWERSLKLIDLLDQDNVRLTLMKDGEHRLSRPQDLELLFSTLAEFGNLA